MNKRILIVNIILIVIVLAIIEFLSYKSYVWRCSATINNQKKLLGNIEELEVKYRTINKFNYEKLINFEKHQKRFYEGDNNKGAILAIGGSYVEGTMLNNAESFSALLNKYTGRTVYNRGYGGTGPQFVYRQLSDINFKKENPNIEYIIYIFVYGYIESQFQDFYAYYLNNIDINYVLKNNKLIEKQRPFWWIYGCFTVKNILENIKNYESEIEIKNGLPLLMKTLEESLKISKELYPNSKFIFVEFPDSLFCKPEIRKHTIRLTKEEVQHIKDLGFTYIYAKDLSGHYFCGDKYRLKDGDHPSAETWAEFTPLLLKELGIN